MNEKNLNSWREQTYCAHRLDSYGVTVFSSAYWPKKVLRFSYALSQLPDQFRLPKVKIKFASIFKRFRHSVTNFSSLRQRDSSFLRDTKDFRFLVTIIPMQSCIFSWLRWKKKPQSRYLICVKTRTNPPLISENEFSNRNLKHFNHY